MNEITAAIKKKAEEHASNGSKTAYFRNHFPKAWNERVEHYASGYLEGIQFMLNFFEILRGDFDEYPNGWECLSEQRCEKWGLQFEIIYGTNQLLAKYLMEDNKPLPRNVGRVS